MATTGVLRAKGNYSIYNLTHLSRVKTMIDVLKRAYLAIVGHNLPRFSVQKPHGQLTDYTTTKKDLARGVSRIPLELSRMSEDRGNDWKSPSQATPRTLTAKSLSESERFIENLNDSITNRNIALQNALLSIN